VCSQLILLLIATFLVVRAQEVEEDLDAKVEDENVVDMDPDEDDEDILEKLEGSSFDEKVHRSERAWMVLVTVDDESACPQCAMMTDVVKGAARALKGLVKSGYVDVSQPENGKILAVSQTPIPHLRLYVAAGLPNAYKRNEYYREFVTFSGQQNSRAVKRFVQEEILKDAPVETSNLGDIDVVLLSSKKSPSATISGLARVLQQANVRVGHFSSFEKDSSEQIDAAKEIGIENPKAPMLVVKGTDGLIHVLDPDALQNAGLESMLEFINRHRTLNFKNKMSEEKESAADSSKIKTPNLFKNFSELDRLVQMKLPVIVAVRHSEIDQETPDDWAKFQEKSHGTNGALVHCDAVDDRLKEEFCSKGSRGKWTFHVLEYVQSIPEDGRENSSFEEVDSLAEARSKALASIPDVVMKLNQGMLQNFLNMAVQQNLVPIVLFAKQKDAPAMLISAAAALQGLVLVGYRGGATNEDLREVGLPDNVGVPQMLSFLPMPTEEGGKGEEAMSIALYDRMRFGKYSFGSVLSFSFQIVQSSDGIPWKDWLKVHGSSIGIDIRDDAESGSNAENNDLSTPFDDPTTELREIGDPQSWEELCPESAGNLLCGIGFFDGSPQNADLGSHREALQTMREKLLNLPSGKSRLRFMWIDATCHTGFLQSFNIEETSLPTLVVFSPKKLVAFKLFQGYSQKSGEKLLSQVANGFGKQPLTLETRPTVKDISCGELPSRQQQEDDGIDQDFLAEIRAEEEAERKRMKEELKKEMDAIKQKEKEAQQALEEEQQQKQRRRRRRRRRKSSEKDEL